MKQWEIDASYRAWYRRTWPNHILAAPTPAYDNLVFSLITQEAIRLFSNSNYFLRDISSEEPEAVIGRLRIRLPNDY